MLCSVVYLVNQTICSRVTADKPFGHFRVLDLNFVFSTFDVRWSNRETVEEHFEVNRPF